LVLRKSRNQEADAQLPGAFAPPRLKGVTEERERRVLIRAAPVVVLAVHDPRLVRVQFQSQIRQPRLQRRLDLAGLPLCARGAQHNDAARTPPLASRPGADFTGRSRRLRGLPDTYGWSGPLDEVLDAVPARITAHIDNVRRLAVHDPLFTQLLDAGVTDNLNQALVELAADRGELTIARWPIHLRSE
jgi:hypothetical protein